MASTNGTSTTDTADTSAELFSATKATSKSQPILLFNPLKVRRNTYIRAISSFPVEIHTRGTDSSVVEANTPICFSSPHTVKLVPIAPLGVEFEKGWRKIPDELRIRILSFNLTFKVPIMEGLGDHSNPQIMRFSDYLRMTPEIESLAKEVFYTRNTFRLESLRGDFFYPNRMVNDFVRKVDFQIFLSPPHVQHLRKFAEGIYGFGKMKRLKVTVILGNQSSGPKGGSPEQWVSYFENLIGDVIEFRCAGEVRFIGGLSTSYLYSDRAHPTVVEKVQGFVRTKFQFGGSKN